MSGRLYKRTWGIALCSSRLLKVLHSWQLAVWTRALPEQRLDAGTPVHWGARGLGVVVCASASCRSAVRCARAGGRRVAESIKRAPPDQPCACVAGACDAAGLARAFARLDGRRAPAALWAEREIASSGPPRPVRRDINPSTYPSEYRITLACSTLL